MHGQFIWYELSTPDVEAAKRFYPRFTGWGTQPFDADYTMWTSNGVPVAGLFRLNAEMQQHGVPPNWLAYVEANDVDATVEKAKSLGGTVVAGPDDIPNTGRFAVLRDPQGATFGVYKAANSLGGGWDGKAVIGRMSWHELMTTDYEAAFRFYQSLFGWEKTGEMDMGGGNMYFMYGKDGAAYGGMFNRMPEMGDMPPFWLLYIHVADVGKAVSQATADGGRVVRPQMDIPGGSIAILGDPQGAGFALHHANAQPAAATPSAPKRKPAARTAKPAKKAATKAAAPKKTTAAKKKSAPKKKSAAKKKSAPKKAAARKAAGKKKAAAKKAPRKTAAKKVMKKKAAARKGGKKLRRASPARSKSVRRKARAKKR